MLALLTSWGVAPPPVALTSWSGIACLDCTHPDWSFDFLDQPVPAFAPSCVLPVPLRAASSFELARKLHQLESAGSAPLGDLLGFSSFVGGLPVGDDLSGALAVRVEARLRSELRARRAELVEYVRPVGVDPAAPGDRVFVHLAPYEGFWEDTRLFSALFDELSFSYGPGPGWAEGVYLLPLGVLEHFEREMRPATGLAPGSLYIARAAQPGVWDTAPFEKGDALILDVVRGLVGDLGLVRVLGTARAIGPS